jgi:hypothetical protein
MLYRHFHIELEPVQAAEELKILKIFVVFDLPKVRCDTNCYAELPQVFFVFAKGIWIISGCGDTTAQRRIFVVFLGASYIVNWAVATSIRSFNSE